MTAGTGLAHKASESLGSCKCPFADILVIKRLTAALLILTFGAGVVSGAPLRTGREECHEEEPAAETSHCAGLARSAEESPEAQAARLCCALNCQGQGAGGTAYAPQVPSPRPAATHPASVAPAAALTLPREQRGPSAARPDESPPVYLLKLALLI